MRNPGRETTAAEALDAYRKLLDVLDFVDGVWPGLQGNQRSFKSVQDRIAAKVTEKLVAEKVDLSTLGRLDLGPLPEPKPAKPRRR